MSIELFGILGALGGGFLGAAFGALVAFVFAGLMIFIGVAILIGSGDATFLNELALGPVFGPHISFAGGVAAAAYAAKRGWIDSGRDIVTPMVSLGKPSVLFVGAAFGLFGYLAQQVIVTVSADLTDPVALSVVLSALLARILFSKCGIVGNHCEGNTGWAKFSTCEKHAWLAYQGSPAMASTLGLFVGGLSAWVAVTLLGAYPEAGGVILIGFAISATSLLFLGVGILVPATHHITLVSAVSVALFSPHVSSDVMLVLIGAVVGLFTALLAECFSRFWLIRGDTHIDPPASAIWPMTMILVLISRSL